MKNDKYFLSDAFKKDISNLRITDNELSLILPDKKELIKIATMAHNNILAPGMERYLANGWALNPDLESFKEGFLDHQLNSRKAIKRNNANLNFMAYVNQGILLPIGAMSIYINPDSYQNNNGEKPVSTGSWLMLDQQRKGYGRRMRRMVLEFAFRELGADTAYTSAHVLNQGSNKVSQSLGYKKTKIVPREDTIPFLDYGKEIMKEQHYRLTKEDFTPQPNIEIKISPNLKEFLAF